MKLLELSKDEWRTHGILRLSQGLTLQQTADEFMVHLNIVEHWRQRWKKLGLAGAVQRSPHGLPKKKNTRTVTSPGRAGAISR